MFSSPYFPPSSQLRPPLSPPTGGGWGKSMKQCHREPHNMFNIQFYEPPHRLLLCSQTTARQTAGATIKRSIPTISIVLGKVKGEDIWPREEVTLLPQERIIINHAVALDIDTILESNLVGIKSSFRLILTIQPLQQLHSKTNQNSGQTIIY